MTWDDDEEQKRRQAYEVSLAAAKLQKAAQ